VSAALLTAVSFRLTAWCQSGSSASQEKPQQPEGPAQEKAKPEDRKAELPSPVPTPPPVPSAGEDVPVSFRLENADLLQVVSLVASQLKMNYVVDPAVKGTVTINTAGELRREDLLPILETILKINGATAIQTGNFYRIVPLAQAPKTALPMFADATGKTLPTDDRMVMQIIPLRFVSAADMAKIMATFLSDGGTVAVHEAGNILILEDNSLNLKRLMEILSQFR
jgi:general secretion pathway protein D